MNHPMAYNILDASCARLGSMGDALHRLLTGLRSACEKCLRRNAAEPASFRLAAGGKR